MPYTMKCCVVLNTCCLPLTYHVLLYKVTHHFDTEWQKTFLFLSLYHLTKWRDKFLSQISQCCMQRISKTYLFSRLELKNLIGTSPDARKVWNELRCDMNIFININKQEKNINTSLHCYINYREYSIKWRAAVLPFLSSVYFFHLYCQFYTR